MTNDILFFAEQQNGKLTKISRELAGGAHRLARELGGRAVAVLTGHDITEAAAHLLNAGTDQVLLADAPMFAHYSTAYATGLMKAAAERIQPSLILLGSTTTGMDLAPAVAAALDTGLVTDCTGLWLAEDDLSPVSARFRMSRPNVNAVTIDTLCVPGPGPAIATVRPGVLSPLAKDELTEATTGSIIPLTLPADFPGDPVTLLSIDPSKKKTEDITSARVLVAGGRGVGSAEDFDTLRRIASLLDGTIACSRACIESGWVDTAFQVGQTGKTVRPELYLACGISGAFQHVTGMEGSRLIISINKNPAAPIFDISDLGIVGSLEVVLPQLLAALEEYRAE